MHSVRLLPRASVRHRSGVAHPGQRARMTRAAGSVRLRASAQGGRGDLGDDRHRHETEADPIQLDRRLGAFAAEERSDVQSLRLESAPLEKQEEHCCGGCEEGDAVKATADDPRRSGCVALQDAT